MRSAAAHNQCLQLSAAIAPSACLSLHACEADQPVVELVAAPVSGICRDALTIPDHLQPADLLPGVGVVVGALHVVEVGHGLLATRGLLAAAPAAQDRQEKDGSHAASLPPNLADVLRRQQYNEDQGATEREVGYRKGWNDHARHMLRMLAAREAL